MSFHNTCASLEFYKESLTGRCQDFIINFNEDQATFERILQLTLDLFRQLIESFPDKIILARLVAKVNFVHVNNVEKEL